MGKSPVLKVVRDLQKLARDAAAAQPAKVVIRKAGDTLTRAGEALKERAS